MPFITLGLPNHDTIPGVSVDDHHAEAHDPEDHTGQGATAAELEVLTDTSDADALHAHAHGNTLGQGVDDHHAESHQAQHLSGGGDVIAGMCRIATGSYTGNGTLSQAITGLGFQPKWIDIVERLATVDLTTGNDSQLFTSDVIIDDLAAGAAWQDVAASSPTLGGSAIIAFGADGFTVDDNGTDRHPNEDGTVYNFMALG